MTEVWVVIWYDGYEESKFKGVFSTHQKAMDWSAKLKAEDDAAWKKLWRGDRFHDGTPNPHTFSVHPYTIDKGVTL